MKMIMERKVDATEFFNHVRLETIQIGALQGAIQIGAGIQIGAMREASA